MAKHEKVSFDHLAKEYKIDSKEVKSMLIEAGVISARNKKVDEKKAQRILDEYVGKSKKLETSNKKNTSKVVISDKEWLKIVGYLGAALLLMLFSFWIMTTVLIKNGGKFVDKEHSIKKYFNQNKQQVEQIVESPTPKDGIPVYVTGTGLEVEEDK